MISRRTDDRQNRGRVSSGVASAAPSTPLTIISSTTFGFWIRGDSGITMATGVTAWADQSPAGSNFGQAGAALQPARNLAGGPNGTTSVQFDGVDDFLTSAFVPGATGFLYLVGRVAADTVSRILFNASNTGSLRDSVRLSNPAAGTLQMANTTPVNATAYFTGTYYRMFAAFTNSVADELKIGATSTVAGVSAGGSGGLGGCAFGAALTGVNASTVELCEAIWTLARPTPGEITNLDAYVTARYGPGLT